MKIAKALFYIIGQIVLLSIAFFGTVMLVQAIWNASLVNLFGLSPASRPDISLLILLILVAALLTRRIMRDGRTRHVLASEEFLAHTGVSEWITGWSNQATIMIDNYHYEFVDIQNLSVTHDPHTGKYTAFALIRVRKM